MISSSLSCSRWLTVSGPVLAVNRQMSLSSRSNRLTSASGVSVRDTVGSENAWSASSRCASSSSMGLSSSIRLSRCSRLNVG